MLSREQIENALAVCNAATKPPWHKGVVGLLYWPGGEDRPDEPIPKVDADFIARAREGWPEALQALVRVREALETIRNRGSEPGFWDSLARRTAYADAADRLEAALDGEADDDPAHA